VTCGPERWAASRLNTLLGPLLGPLFPRFTFANSPLLSLLLSDAGLGYVTAFVTTVVIDQLNATDPISAP
jgi:hypothetical protein